MGDWRLAPPYVRYFGPIPTCAEYRDPHTNEEMIFRRRSRMTWSSFTRLIKLFKDKDCFPTVGKPDAIGIVGAPLELLVYCTMRIMGSHGETLDF